jgi:hypothetical protein
VTFTALPILAVLGLAIGLAVVLGGGDLEGFIATIQGRGSRVGPRTHVDDMGIVEDDPQSLASAAGVELNRYALARMISSEEGNSATLVKIAVAFAAVNEIGAEGIAGRLLGGHGEGQGHFKKQGYSYSGGKGSVYASTAQDPYDDDVNIATAVLGGTLADPTGGATNFFRPELQDQQYRAGDTTRDADGIVALWRSRGLVPVEVDGIDEVLFFRKEA